MSSVANIDNSKGGLVEQVLIKGDLSSLNPEQRSSYYLQVCDSVGLNPLTKPFEYITLNGKLTLYALRACTDQLRTVHGVSVIDMNETEREGVFIVTAKVQNKEGRTDMAKGAVSISGLKGESLANALMKAETKAKRRATLSLCGLGLLDESEIETIPNAYVGEPNMTNVTPGENKPAYIPSDPLRPQKDAYVVAASILVNGSLDFDEWVTILENKISAATTANELSLWNRANSKTLKAMEKERPDLFTWFGEQYRKKSQTLI